MENSAGYDDFAYHVSLLMPFDIEEETKESTNNDDKEVNKKLSRKSHSGLTETTLDSFKIGQTLHGKNLPVTSVKSRRARRAQSTFL